MMSLQDISKDLYMRFMADSADIDRLMCGFYSMYNHVVSMSGSSRSCLSEANLWYSHPLSLSHNSRDDA